VVNIFTSIQKGFTDLVCIRQYTIQYNTIQYNTIQYNTIQYNTIQYNTIQYNTSISLEANGLPTIHSIDIGWFHIHDLNNLDRIAE
jgi:hypothetical protein